MPFGDNSGLIKAAIIHNIANNGTNDIIGNEALASAFVFGNNAGDDLIENFGKDDSIITKHKIFDGNNDGIVDFGPNGILDIDRVTAGNAGANQITLQGLDSKQVRYLGTKEGFYAYADASVRLAGFTEGKVADEWFDGGTGAKKFFYDTALGLNLGGDTIVNFGVDDRIVTTSKIYNGPDQGIAITFGQNGVLDLPGKVDGFTGDLGAFQGGQIDLVGQSEVYLLDTQTVAGVTYYYYGLEQP
jgi:hypothetical protein